MAYSRIVNRFENDLEYLLWKSNVYRLSSGEINSSFEQLKNTYTKLANNGDRHELEVAISRWSTVMEKTADMHQLYPSTGMAPSH